MTTVDNAAETPQRVGMGDQMRGRRGSQVFFNADCSGSNSYYFDEHGDVPLRASTG